MATKREILLATLHHEETIVPSWTMGYFDIKTAIKLLGEDNVVTDYEPAEQYKLGATSGENRARNLRYSEIADNFAIGVGQGANFAFGHGGPGEFVDRIIERNADFYISQYETGVKKKTNRTPHFYYNYDHPLQSLEELAEVVIPDANDQNRYRGIREDVEFYKKAGYFTFANLNGFFF